MSMRSSCDDAYEGTIRISVVGDRLPASWLFN
jgi:hypothetical protein